MRKVKFTKQQAGAIGGAAGTGKKKRRGGSEYYRALRAGKKLTEPERGEAIDFAKANDLPLVETSNPVAPPPPGFTHRPAWQG